MGGGLLLGAGMFQFTALKYACLTRCRSPWRFLLNEWREGSCGAFFVLVEKVAPEGRWVNRISGFLLIGWGMWMLARHLG